MAKGFSHADLFGPVIAPGYRGQRLGSELLDASRGDRRRARPPLRRRLGRAAQRLRAPAARAQGLPRPRARQGGVPARPRGAPGRGRRGRRASRCAAGAQPTSTRALTLYHSTFPEGVFPDEAWQEGLAKGSVYLAERAGTPLAFVNIDANDRWAYQIGVVAEERSRGVGNFLLSRVLEDYWREHPDEVVGLSVEADNVAALKLLRRQGFAPWLVLQPYELWL